MRNVRIVDMRTLRDPLLDLAGDPQSIDANRDDGEQHPAQPMTEQRAALAIEFELVSVNDLMVYLPTILAADDPRNDTFLLTG